MKVSIKTMIDRVLRHPLMSDITEELVLDYTNDFIQICGMNMPLIEKRAKIDIVEHRGELPCDLLKIIQVMGKGSYYYSMDNFHPTKSGNDTYNIQGSYIFTSNKEVSLDVVYKAIPTDEEGYPMVEDDAFFLTALEAYIKKQWFTILFDTGKIHPNVYNQASQDYAWAIARLTNTRNNLSEDERESFIRMWNTFYVDRDRHSRGGKV